MAENNIAVETASKVSALTKDVSALSAAVAKLAAAITVPTTEVNDPVETEIQDPQGLGVFEDALKSIVMDVAKNGPKLQMIKTRRGVVVDNLSQMAINMILDAKGEYKNFRTRSKA